MDESGDQQGGGGSAGISWGVEGTSAPLPPIFGNANAGGGGGGDNEFKVRVSCVSVRGS